MGSIKTAATHVVPGICILVLCACAVCQEDQAEVLRLIIEKAREREAALERADLKYSGRAASVPGVAPIAVAFRGHYLKSQERFRHEVQARIKGLGVEQSIEAKMAYDGEAVRMLQEQPNQGWYGSIQKREESFQPRVPTPEGVGVTRLFGTPGTLSEFLEADTAKLSEKYGDSFTAPDALMRTAVRGRETVGERECVVVESSVDPGDGSPETTHRLYFAEDLGYACVKFEAGRPTPDGLKPMYSVTMDDFREVMPGVFLPFAVSANAFSGNGQVEATVECKLESIEFPEYFDESAFTLVFPDGTTLWDNMAGVNYTVGVGGPQDGTTEDMLLEMAAEVMIPEEPPPAPVVEIAEPVPPLPPEAPPEQPAEEEYRFPIAAVVLGVALAVVLGILIFLGIHLKRRRT